MDKYESMARNFSQLHRASEPFVIPNPWDAGSARMLQAKGFKALATTSTGFVFAGGRGEGSNQRESILEHCRELVNLVDIPVSADLEHGYAEDLKGVEETYRLAVETGLAGGSIEDARIMTDEPLMDFSEAVDRVQAAVQGARSGKREFTVTARAENFLYGRRDLADTIRRLQAFQEAGADVLYAPGLTRLQDVRDLVASVDRPVNVLANKNFTFLDLKQAGVKRISVGSALFRLAFGRAVQAADEMLQDGKFDFTSEAMSFTAINSLFE